MISKINNEGTIYHPLKNKRVGYFTFFVGKEKPLAIILPGGGYRDVSCIYEGFPIAKRLNELGYNAIVLVYSFGKMAEYPKPIEDLRDLFEDLSKINKENKIKITDYCVIGFSAGAHLAGLWSSKKYGYLKYNLPKPKTAMLIYPVISLAENANYDSRVNFLGKKMRDHNWQKELSIHNNVDKDYPTVYMWQFEDDTCVPVENSLMMEKVLKENNVVYHFKIYPGKHHGTGLSNLNIAKGWLEEAVDFWQNQN